MYCPERASKWWKMITRLSARYRCALLPLTIWSSWSGDLEITKEIEKHQTLLLFLSNWYLAQTRKPSLCLLRSEGRVTKFVHTIFVIQFLSHYIFSTLFFFFTQFVQTFSFPLQSTQEMCEVHIMQWWRRAAAPPFSIEFSSFCSAASKFPSTGPNFTHTVTAWQSGCVAHFDVHIFIHLIKVVLAAVSQQGGYSGN